MEGEVAEVIHNRGIKEMERQGGYEMSLYHNFRHEINLSGDRGRIENDGHVANVVRVTKLYLKASKNLSDDPLKVFEKSNRFIDNNISEAGGIDSDRKKHLIRLALVEAAKWHDVGNVVEGVDDWDKLIASGGQEGVKPLTRMRINGAEQVASEMFGEFVNKGGLKQEGLTDAEKKLVAGLGKEMIMGTEFSRGFGSDKLDFLGIIDQTAALLNPNGPRMIVGLIEEGRQRVVGGEQGAPQQFDRDGYFGGFVPWRFGEYQKAGGVGMKEFFQFLDSYKDSDLSGFEKVIGVGEKEMIALGKVGVFVEKKVKQQLEIGSQLWPPGKTDFAKAFDGWSQNGKKTQMEKACLAFKDNFWD